MLARQVSLLIAQGRRIEVQNPFDTILIRGRLVELRERVVVDEFGSVRVDKLPVDRSRVIMLVGAAAVLLAFIIYAVTTS